MFINLATDHAGFEHKEAVKDWLISENFSVIDHGALTFNDKDDFPDFIALAAGAVSRRPGDRAIIFGGSGQGEAMVANRYPRVRAAVFYGGNDGIPSLSRQHNNANVLSIGARFVSIDETKKVIWDWLHTDFLTEEKYKRRNDKIEKITRHIVSTGDVGVNVVPAVIPKTQSDLESELERLSFSPEIQLDLVDGKFVKQISWPYSPLGEPLSIKRRLRNFIIEVDLMVESPLAAAYRWLEAEVRKLVFHIETIAFDDLKKFIKSKPNEVLIGVSMHGDTSLDKLFSYAEIADYVQLMGIKEIGAQGLPFDSAVLEKIKQVRQRFPNMIISIDGSVNRKTIKDLFLAGADRFVCGSAIIKEKNPKQAWKDLRFLINE